MPFIGKSPTAGFASIVKDDLTPNGSTTAFTLSKQVANANDIAVFLGNVRQEPTDAYTVSGTTLTMSEAPASGLNFYVLHIAGTVESSVVPADNTISTAKIQNDAITGAKIENNPTIAGNLTVSGTSTNTGLITASAGVAIGGTGAANTLDDYEEGTWTATLGGSGSDPTVSSYSYNSGHYTKIGRQVYAHIYMRIESGDISGGSGDGIIRGLPFAAKSSGSISNGVGGWIENYWSTSTSFSSGRNFPALYLAAGSNYIGIWQKSTNDPTQYTGWSLGQIDNASFLVGGVLVYMTDL